MSLTKFPLAGNNLIIPTRKSLVIDITVGDGKIENLFLQYTEQLIMNYRSGNQNHKLDNHNMIGYRMLPIKTFISGLPAPILDFADTLGDPKKKPASAVTKLMSVNSFDS
jgi:hypothetical protein